MRNPLRFLWIWLATLAVLAGVVVVINYVIDPYDVFGTPRRPAVNALKPAARDYSMLAKTYQVNRFHPRTVLIGASSTHIGVDAADPAWPASTRPVFNYGIPGGYAMSVGLGTLREAIATGDVKEAVIFLDFQNFFIPEQAAGGLTDDDKRYHLLPDGRPNPYRREQAAKDMFLSLFTMNALTDSIGTVLRQRGPETLNIAPDGSSTESDFINAARTDGMHDLFAQKLDFEVPRAKVLAKAVADLKGPMPNLGIVAQLIDMAQAHDVKLILVLTPHHADALELYWREGLWPRIEQLKTELADLVARKDHGVVLWDFLDYTPYATEPVPPAGDRHTQTHWFWESTHFKKALGHIIIARINGAAEPDYGAILTPETVAARNQQVRAQRNAVVCEAGQHFLSATSDDGCQTQARQAARQVN